MSESVSFEVFGASRVALHEEAKKMANAYFGNSAWAMPDISAEPEVVDADGSVQLWRAACRVLKATPPSRRQSEERSRPKLRSV